MPRPPAGHDRARADDTARRQRRLQRAQDAADARADAGSGGGRGDAPVQAGARDQPAAFAAQHLDKPGREAELETAPRYLAPDYAGSGKLQGMAALVTGGDSGIGRAVAVLYAREGADVAIVYLDEHDDARRTREAVEAEGRRALCLAGDVRRTGFCQRAVQETVAAFGRLDVLVNNAAFQLHADSIDALDDERLDETLRTNVHGAFHMVRAALPHLGRGASIINTGSVVGLRGHARLIDYATSKGALHAFTKSLAQQLLDRGVRVNAVAPGPVWTPLNPADRPAAELGGFGGGSDIGRAAQPEELSPAYVFLAAPVCAGYITGIVLPVTGSVDAI